MTGFDQSGESRPSAFVAGVDGGYVAVAVGGANAAAVAACIHSVFSFDLRILGLERLGHGS